MFLLSLPGPWLRELRDRYIYWGFPHFQMRIAGKYWPCLVAVLLVLDEIVLHPDETP